MTPPLPPLAAAPAPARAARLDGATIDRLEASFLEEMLKYVGPKGATDPFSEGGESQFQSFLTQHYAARLPARLDLGLTRGSAA